MEERENSNKKGINLLDLPEGCLSHILSLTSPLYILRLSLVCRDFCSLGNSDLVWDKFVPCDFDQPTIQRFSAYPTKKHIVLHLCSSYVLFDGDFKSCSVDKWTGKKCYMLGARELKIVSGDNPHCWRWKPLSDSRFPEVAELLAVNHLQLTGKIRTQLLSPNTTYHAYFSFKLRSWSCGFDICPVKVAVSMVDSTGAYLRGSSSTSGIPRTYYLKAKEYTSKSITLEDEEVFVNGEEPADRWLKIDMGKYFNRADSNVAALEITLMGTDSNLSKSGLIVHGIELLPLN